MNDIYEYTLEFWNESEFKNHFEATIAHVDATIRLLCIEPLDIGRKICGAHFRDLPFYVKRNGEMHKAIECNACRIQKSRKLGKIPYMNGKHE